MWWGPAPKCTLFLVLVWAHAQCCGFTARVSLWQKFQHFLNPPKEEMNRYQHTWGEKKKQKLHFLLLIFLWKHSWNFWLLGEVDYLYRKLSVPPVFPISMETNFPGWELGVLQMLNVISAQGQMCGHQNNSRSILRAPGWKLLVNSHHFQLWILLGSSGIRSELNFWAVFASQLIPGSI